MDALEALGGETWFRLGDRDLATHLYRTERLADGATLSRGDRASSASLLGVPARLIPMSDDPVSTRSCRSWTDPKIAFQDYFVRLRHQVPVKSVRFDGAGVRVAGTRGARGDRERRGSRHLPFEPDHLDRAVACRPRNRRCPPRHGARDVVAISPIVAGAALKGPADHLMAELGHEPSVVGVARIYSDLASTLIIDDADADPCRQRSSSAGMRCVVTPT